MTCDKNSNASSEPRGVLNLCERMSLLPTSSAPSSHTHNTTTTSVTHHRTLLLGPFRCPRCGRSPSLDPSITITIAVAQRKQPICQQGFFRAMASPHSRFVDLGSLAPPWSQRHPTSVSEDAPSTWPAFPPSLPPPNSISLLCQPSRRPVQGRESYRPQKRASRASTTSITKPAGVGIVQLRNWLATRHNSVPLLHDPSIMRCA